MGLMDRLREAEQSGREAARVAFGKAKELGGDAQRRMRQKMRIYPAAAAANPSEVSQSNPAGIAPPLEQSEDVRHLEVTAPKPIVSVHGEDIDPARISGKDRKIA